MFKKAKIIYCGLASILTPILFNPHIAQADPKTDIANYEAAFEKGDIVKALELGEIAFANSKRELSANNPYIAKIGFDLASMYIQIYEEKKAFTPISTTLKLLKDNPEIAANADMKQVEAMYAISLFAIENEDKEKIKLDTIKLLENAVKKLPNDYENSEYATKINYDLSLYYSNKNDWSKLSKFSNDLIKSSFIAYPNDTTALNRYLFLGYSLRGASTFVLNLRSSNSVDLSKTEKLLSEEDTPLFKRNWADSWADIRRARKIIGPRKSPQDNIYYGLLAWDSLISAYSTQIFSSEKITSEYDKRINDELNSKETDYSNIEDIEHDKSCKNKVNYKYKIFFSNYLTLKYNFASTIAMFDVGSDNMPTNIRILAVIPDKEFGKLVESGIKNAKLISIAKDAPSYCLKDYILNVRFVVR